MDNMTIANKTLDKEKISAITAFPERETLYRTYGIKFFNLKGRKFAEINNIDADKIKEYLNKLQEEMHNYDVALVW